MKRGNWVLVIVAFVLIFGIGFLWLSLFGAESPAGKEIIDAADGLGVDVYYGDVPIDGDSQLQEVSEENLSDSSSGGGSSGGGSGGGESGGSFGDNCQMIQIAYSLKNFQESMVCVESGPLGCTNLAVNCSMYVYHEDSNAGGGDFGIRFKVVDSEENVLDDSLVVKYLEYGQSELFSEEFNIIDSNGVDENLDCTFDSEIIPKREYCA